MRWKEEGGAEGDAMMEGGGINKEVEGGEEEERMEG